MRHAAGLGQLKRDVTRSLATGQPHGLWYSTGHVVARADPAAPAIQRERDRLASRRLRPAEVFTADVRQAEGALAARWPTCDLLSAVTSTMPACRPC